MAKFSKSDLLALVTPVVGLQHFAVALIKHARRGQPLDEENLRAIAEEALVHLKNADVEGVSLDDQADGLGRAVTAYRGQIDLIISRSR